MPAIQAALLEARKTLSTVSEDPHTIAAVQQLKKGTFNALSQELGAASGSPFATLSSPADGTSSGHYSLTLHPNAGANATDIQKAITSAMEKMAFTKQEAPLLADANPDYVHPSGTLAIVREVTEIPAPDIRHGVA